MINIDIDVDFVIILYKIIQFWRIDVQKILYGSICTTLNLIMISHWSKRELSLNSFKI